MSPAVQWIETHKNHIMVFIVLGLILLYFVTRYQTEIRNTNESATDLYETVTNDYLAATDKKEPMKIDVGSEALKEKIQKMNAPKNGGDTSLDATAALAQFNDLMDSESIYASTDVVDYAKLIYGNFLYDNDRFTEAIEQYKAYIDAMTLTQDRIAGYEGIVFALEAQAMKKETNQKSALTKLLKKIKEIGCRFVCVPNLGLISSHEIKKYQTQYNEHHNMVFMCFYPLYGRRHCFNENISFRFGGCVSCYLYFLP